MSETKIREAIDSLFEGQSVKFSEIITKELDNRKENILDREYTALAAKTLSESVETAGHAMMVADMTKNLDIDSEDLEDDEEELDLSEFEDDIEDIVNEIRAMIIDGK